MKKTILPCLILLLVFFTSACQKKPDLSKLDSVDFETLHKWAQEGHADSQCEVGLFYLESTEYHNADYKVAEEWLIKSAKQGNGKAQYSLGFLYERGDMLKGDSDQAFYWYTEAVKNQYPGAHSSLARFYLDGTSTEKDPQKAIDLYKKAVSLDKEYTVAGLLGDMYRYGCCEDKEIEVNDKESFKWYSKGAEGGDYSSQYNLGVAYENGLGTQIDQEEAASWYAKAAKQGSPLAQYALGMRYLQGLGIEQDFILAHKWLSLSVIVSQTKDYLGSKTFIYGNKHVEASHMIHSLEQKMSKEDISKAQSLVQTELQNL